MSLAYQRSCLNWRTRGHDWSTDFSIDYCSIESIDSPMATKRRIKLWVSLRTNTFSQSFATVAISCCLEGQTCSTDRGRRSGRGQRLAHVPVLRRAQEKSHGESSLGGAVLIDWSCGGYWWFVVVWLASWYGYLLNHTFPLSLNKLFFMFLFLIIFYGSYWWWRRWSWWVMFICSDEASLGSWHLIMGPFNGIPIDSLSIWSTITGCHLTISPALIFRYVHIIHIYIYVYIYIHMYIYIYTCIFGMAWYISASTDGLIPDISKLQQRTYWKAC